MNTARAPRPDRHGTATTVLAIFAVATGGAAVLALHFALRFVSPDHIGPGSFALGLAASLAAIGFAINALVLLLLAVMSPVTDRKDREKEPDSASLAGQPGHRPVPIRQTPVRQTPTDCRIMRSGRACR